MFGFGGGIATQPHLAKKLDIFVLPENVLNVTIGVATIFRDFGFRAKRNRARLKFLVQEWGIAKFQDKLIELTGKLPSSGIDKIIAWNTSYLLGVHPQKQDKKLYLGLTIPQGRLTTAELDGISQLAKQYGDGSLRLTGYKNIVITNIAETNIRELLNEPLLDEFLPASKIFATHAMGCTGKEFCSKGLVRTRPWLQAIGQYLDDRLPCVDTPIHLHISGCSNSCGQTHIADIGLQGTLIKSSQGIHEAFEIYLGGLLGPNATLAKKLDGRILAEFAPLVTAEMITVYLRLKKKQENIAQCIERVGIEPYQKRLNELLPIAGNRIEKNNNIRRKNIV